MDAARPTAPLLREPIAAPSAAAVSPELALVDPELAAWARQRLPDIAAARLVLVPGLHAPVDREAQVRASRGDAPAGAAPAGVPRVRLLVAAAAVLLGAGVACGFLLRPVVVGDQLDASGRSSTPVVPSVGAKRSSPVTAPRPVPTPAPRGSGSGQTKRPERPLADVPDLVWPPVSGADGYRVSLYRSGRLVYSAVRRSAHLRLSRSWVYRGKRYRLTAGSYRWVVWPIERKSGGPTVPRAIVDATLRV